MKWCYPWHKSGMYPPIESKYFTFRKHFKYFKVLLCQLSLKNYLSKITIITLVLSFLHITSKVIFLKEKWNCLTPLFKKFQKYFITSKTKVLSDHIWPAMISLHYLLFNVFLFFYALTPWFCSFCSLHMGHSPRGPICSDSFLLTSNTCLKCHCFQDRISDSCSYL